MHHIKQFKGFSIFSDIFNDSHSQCLKIFTISKRNVSILFHSKYPIFILQCPALENLNLLSVSIDVLIQGLQMNKIM